MNQTFNLLLFLKKSKIKADGTVPIYLRITVDGVRKEIAAKRNVLPDQWDAHAQKVIGRTPAVRMLNDYLETFKEEVRAAQHQLMKERQKVTSTSVKRKVTGADRKTKMLVPIFQEHNDRMKKLVPQEFAEGTYERYVTSLSHTKDFIKWKFGADDIDIEEINIDFIIDYDYYLRTERKCANNTTVKYMKNFQKIINICLDKEWIAKNPFKNYTGKVEDVDPDFLTEDEMQTILDKKFVSPRLALVRDIFIFSCFTGLAYADVKRLTTDHISIGIDGGKWIFTHRKKTDNASHIPLLPIPLAILEQYKEHPRCLNDGRLLPILSNQKMNSYLKEIGDVCGIKKDLTFHVARHTFATSVTLQNGVPLESVGKMMGHKSLKSTQHYARVLDKKVSDDMKALRNKFITPTSSEAI